MVGSEFRSDQPVDSDARQLNTVAWFEIASDTADATRAFYSEVFGWSYVDTPWGWSLIIPPGATAPVGHIWDRTAQKMDFLPSNGIMVLLQVEDVDVACEKVVAAGGSIVVPPMGNEDGAIRFALVRDIKDNLLGIGRPRSSSG